MNLDDKGSPPAYEAGRLYVPSSENSPPPAYDTVVRSKPVSFDQSRSNPVTHKCTVLTIDGKYIMSTDYPDWPIYSLSHALDGHELGIGIMVTRLAKKRPDPNSISQRYQIPGSDVSRKDVFALREKMQLFPSSGVLLIDGRQYLSEKLGRMTRSMTRYGPGWTAGGDGLPLLEARPALFAKRRLSNPELSGADGRFYEWRLKKSEKDKEGTLIAIETRRRWDKQNKVEISKPTLELKTDLDPLGRKFLDFFVAAWAMHNWRDAKDVTKEPLLWEEFKEQAKVTKKKHADRRNMGVPGLGYLAAAAIS
ncbi:hypothetical protein AJ79_02409 [Helicocarpus griseus UAMH5409]|uniref:Uncharacterized protein n=1 Tax=Helicocarpus griseus UAMH5409 TaxID=1447875 RepID=A0A2B7Y322_9EURO|nr:hypothetical protein AJ79_02409 [Helicocarpus griseus UAMH5409]